MPWVEERSPGRREGTNKPGRIRWAGPAKSWPPHAWFYESQTFHHAGDFRDWTEYLMEKKIDLKIIFTLWTLKSYLRYEPNRDAHMMNRQLYDYGIRWDTVTDMHAVGLTIVDDNPVRIELGYSIGRARIEWSLLGLRNLLHEAIQFTSWSLIEAYRLVNADRAKGVKQPQRT